MVNQPAEKWPKSRCPRKIKAMFWRRAWIAIRLVLFVALAVVIIAPEWPAFGDTKFQFQAIVGRERRFDFLTWSTEALGKKAQAVLAGTYRYLPDEAKKEFVLAYLSQLARIQQLEAEIERIYADPAVIEPQSATVELQVERDSLRRDLVWRQPLAEAIVQQQVGTLLAEAGLAIGGVTWPPVLMTMSPVPYMLIVSPRDRIAQVDSAALIPGLSTEDKEQLEDDVFDRLDQSALVVPIGGLGTYPAMIRETSSINWLAEVTAHEWTHHWLSLRPLGVRYLDSSPMRTINETVASLVDLEIGPLVIGRYYPELAPKPAVAAPTQDEPTGPVFDFSAEMGETRTTVDRLLAEGQIEPAEAYMEQRRRVFVENGYPIRKLNQAYFAFYGGYAAEPGGASGGDPIGPMLRELRAASPSLRQFLVDVGRITSYEDLVEVYHAKVGAEPVVQ